MLVVGTEVMRGGRVRKSVMMIRRERNIVLEWMQSIVVLVMRILNGLLHVKKVFLGGEIEMWRCEVLKRNPSITKC